MMNERISQDLTVTICTTAGARIELQVPMENSSVPGAILWQGKHGATNRVFSLNANSVAAGGTPEYHEVDIVVIGWTSKIPL